jgi:hypothetical protein
MQKLLQVGNGKCTGNKEKLAKSREVNYSVAVAKIVCFAPGL